MSDAPIPKDTESIRPPEETKFSGTEIKGFMQGLKQNIDPIFNHWDERRNWENLFPEKSQFALAESFLTGFVEGASNTDQKYNRLVPKGAARAFVWVFLGPLAKIGAKEEEATEALDGNKEYAMKEIAELHPIQENESIQLTDEDVNSVGKVVGELMWNLKLAGRETSDIQPSKGNLGRTRMKWALNSKDRLRFLDTFLYKSSQKTKKS